MPIFCCFQIPTSAHSELQVPNKCDTSFYRDLLYPLVNLSFNSIEFVYLQTDLVYSEPNLGKKWRGPRKRKQKLNSELKFTTEKQPMLK